MRKRQKAARRVASRGGWPSGLILLLVGSCFCSASKAPPDPAPAPPATPAPSTSAVAVVAPEALAGEWLFEMKTGGEPVQSSLHFSVTNGILAGSLTGPDGNARELSKIALKDDKVAWDIEGQSGTLHYEATVSGSSMKGKAKRTRSQRREGGDSGGGSGGGYGGHGRGGGRGGGGRGNSRNGEGQMTFSAYKSVAPPAGETIPRATPTPEPATTAR